MSRHNFDEFYMSPGFVAYRNAHSKLYQFSNKPIIDTSTCLYSACFVQRLRASFLILNLLYAQEIATTNSLQLFSD